MRLLQSIAAVIVVISIFVIATTWVIMPFILVGGIAYYLLFQ
jgi:hypothetical protein